MTAEKMTPKGNTKKKKSKAPIIILIVILLMGLAAVGGFMVGSSMIKPPEIHRPVIGGNTEKTPEEERVDGIYNVLVVGTDKVGLNTDTILVASLDSKNNRINIMSIPRDTMSNVSRKVKKINSAYSIDAKDGKGNIDSLKKEVKYLMGFDVDSYVVVNLSAFEELIDAVGGVKINVPKAMNYDDPYQNLHIHIPAGEQVLNGEQAVGFCRYRSGYAEGDLGRVKAQQTFIKALINQVATPSIITKVPQLSQIVLDNMETDLSAGEILWFAKEALEVDMENDMQTFILPGEPRWAYSLSYYIPDGTKVLEVVNENFNPYEEELTMADLNIVDVTTLPKEVIPGKTKDENKEEDSENPGDEASSEVDNEKTENDNLSALSGESESGVENENSHSTGLDAGSGSEVAVPGEVLKGDMNYSDEQSDNQPSSEEMQAQEVQENSPVSEVKAEPSSNGGVPGEVLKADAE